MALQVIRTHDVENPIDTAPSRFLESHAGEILTPIVDCPVRTETQTPLALLVATSRGEHLRAQRPRPLDCKRANPTATALDEHAHPRSQRLLHSEIRIDRTGG